VVPIFEIGKQFGSYRKKKAQYHMRRKKSGHLEYPFVKGVVGFFSPFLSWVLSFFLSIKFGRVFFIIL
jgi:hypothetical protein